MMMDQANWQGWFARHLREEILPLWLRHAPTERGLFRCQFDRQWRARERDLCTLVSQARLLYNFAEGYRQTGETAYLQAVSHGAGALLRDFHDSEYGGWYWGCTLSGEVSSSRKDLYGHAFVIFGLAHAAAVTGREDFLRAALETWELIDTRFRLPQGGFAVGFAREFTDPSPELSQNPLMHLFEALCALAPLDGSGRIRAASEEVADFVLTRLVRAGDGRLPEVYDAVWRELPEEHGGRLDIGHAFEWAYLLSRAVEQGWPDGYLPFADRLLAYGLALGQAHDGGILSPATPDGRVTTRRKGWWEQCEAARALAHFLVVRRREDLAGPLAALLAFVRATYPDPEYGGWYASPPGACGDDSPTLDKASEWKLDYHVVGLCAEALRLFHPAGIV